MMVRSAIMDATFTGTALHALTSPPPTTASRLKKPTSSPPGIFPLNGRASHALQSKYTYRFCAPDKPCRQKPSSFLGGIPILVCKVPSRRHSEACPSASSKRHKTESLGQSAKSVRVLRRTVLGGSTAAGLRAKRRKLHLQTIHPTGEVNFSYSDVDEFKFKPREVRFLPEGREPGRGSRCG